MNKLKYTIFIVFIFSTISSLASTIIAYSYDYAGNRISRTCIEVTMPNMRSTSANVDSSKIATDLGGVTVTIYPNPVRGVLWVQLTGKTTNIDSNCSIYSPEGKLLESLQMNAASAEIKMFHYAPGWYLLHVTVGDKKQEFKIIKQ